MEENKLKDDSKSSVMDSISKLLKLLVELSGAYVVIKGLSNVIYQYQSENFYKLPAKYFTNQNMDMNWLAVFIAIAVVIVCELPPIVDYIFKHIGISENSKDYKPVRSWLFYTIPISFFLGVFNALKVVKIFGLNNIIIVVICVLAFIVFGFIALNGVFYIEKRISRNEKNNTNKAGKKGWLWYVVVIFTIVTILPCWVLLFQEGNTDPQYKKEYEFVMVDETEYVIITTYEGKNLLVNYEVDEKEKYTFFMDEYFFIEEGEGSSYRYIRLNEIEIKSN